MSHHFPINWNCLVAKINFVKANHLATAPAIALTSTSGFVRAWKTLKYDPSCGVRNARMSQEVSKRFWLEPQYITFIVGYKPFTNHLLTSWNIQVG